MMITAVLLVAGAMSPGMDLSAAERAAIEAGLTLESDGVETLEVGSGIAVIAASTAYYDVEVANPALLLQGQRFASVQASLGAEAALVRYFEGLDQSALTEIVDSFQAEDRSDSSSVRAEFSAEQSGAEVAKGVLRGAVVYEIQDRPDEGAVTVWMASSPKTRGALARTSGRGVSFTDYQAGLDHIVSTVLSRTVPPMGGSILTVPGTGETAFVGFGVALIHPGSAKRSGRLAGRAKQSAKNTSRQLANVSLLGCIQGKPIEVEGEFSEEYRSLITDDGQSVEAEAVSVTLDEEALRSARSGKVPPGVIYKSVTSEDGHWTYTFAILRGATAKKDADRPRRSSSSPDRAPSRGERPSEQTTFAREAPACGEDERRGVEAVLVRMAGPSRQSALSAALLEAIQRTQGVQLEASLAMQSRFAAADAFVNGEEFSASVATAEEAREVSMKTAGLVESYSVISEGKVDGGYELEVCVRIPSFDPNWRPGGKQVIAVLPFESREGSFQVSGERVSTAGALRDLEGLLVQSLLESGEYFVIDRRNSKRVEALLQEVRSGVASGKMQAREGGKLGRLKGIDIVVTATLDRLEYTNYDIYIEALRRSEARSRLSVRSTCSITNVADGTLLGKSTVDRSWGGDLPSDLQALQSFLGKWKGYQPATAAFAEAAGQHLREIDRVTEVLRNARRLKVVEAMEDGTLLLEAFQSEFTDQLREGDPLNVKWRKVASSGKEFLLDRCHAEVVSIQGAGLVVAKIVPEDGATMIQKAVRGDFAELAD